MSKFKIYRIDNDPIRTGIRRRRLNVLFGILSFVFIITFLVLMQIFYLSFVKSYLLTFLVVGGFFYYLYFRLKAENKKIKIIGSIEFTRTCIVKHIGDSVTEFNYDNIRTIELTPHIPAVEVAESKSGYFSYILTLDFKDDHKENLVVSDKPLDESRDLSITGTLKTLRKIISAGVILK
jgi:hypothetical protein